LVPKFKQVQDAIGKWHDWATLEQLAGRCLDPDESGPLRNALHAHVEREYRRARRTAQGVRDWMMEAHPAFPASNVDTSPKLIRKAG
jgi:CHAD domain-containing protein